MNRGNKIARDNSIRITKFINLFNFRAVSGSVMTNGNFPRTVRYSREAYAESDKESTEDESPA